ncbi:MAG TPA: helix-turn-helix transcriptional regulator, partial [Actinotalea sp.]|nr:helix-turn-helix transcriptional regulator [Actinotalea sp.]
PGHRWTVGEPAGLGAVSRSALGARFRDVLGLPPMQYVARWRVHRAQDLLASTDLGVAAVARRVGYDAEEAFSRAFKRGTGLSPAAWRSAIAAGGLSPRPAAAAQPRRQAAARR